MGLNIIAMWLRVSNCWANIPLESLQMVSEPTLIPIGLHDGAVKEVEAPERGRGHGVVHHVVRLWVALCPHIDCLPRLGSAAVWLKK